MPHSIPRIRSKKNLCRWVRIILICCCLQLPTCVYSDPLIFISTQLNPTKEAMSMRSHILKGFHDKVLFKPYDDRVIFQLLIKDTIQPPDILGGTVGDFVSLKGEGLLKNLNEDLKKLPHRNFLPGMVEMGSLQTQQQKFIPWMQATYLMVAKRSALQYLPPNVDLSQLTYQQLIQWSANMHRAAGTPKTGFPASPKGLMYRFVQGYLYPSFTGGMIRHFRDNNAVTMWQTFKELWKHVNVLSLSFNSMQEPLLTGEVWLAWDHTSRLLEVFKQHPEEFVAFPAPIGPKGRGYMLVLAGLGIPKNTLDPRSMELIEYLTSTQIQVKTLETTGFFPVTQDAADAADKLAPPYLVSMINAVSTQTSTANAVVSTLPYGFDEYTDQFNRIYKRSFTQIILRNKEIQTVLDEQAQKLQSILAITNAQCFPPDTPSFGPCPVR